MPAAAAPERLVQSFAEIHRLQGAINSPLLEQAVERGVPVRTLADLLAAWEELFWAPPPQSLHELEEAILLDPR